ncbi:MAG: hypothetical protein MUD01_08555 [Chloroflexaceae bacterium]|jgi:hypothetical protein|nr:hypothetical protein [Chloroflexaceae bacterium]
MELLINLYSVEYTPGGTLTFLHLVQGHVAAQFDSAQVEELKGLLSPVQKRIYRMGDAYNLITGANGDMSVYHISTGRRAVYLTPDETQQLKGLLLSAER